MQSGVFQTDEGDHLLIVVHHLIIDGVSWRILIEDFISGYQQMEQQQEVRFPHKTASYQAWANALTKYAQNEQIKKELPYWTQIVKIGSSNIPIVPRSSVSLQMKHTKNIVIHLDPNMKPNYY